MKWQLLYYRSFMLIFFVCLQVSVHAQTFPAPYCSISFTTNTEPITLVKFAGINSVTTDVASPSTPQMEDLTGTIGYVKRGDNYQITLKGNTDGPYTAYFAVYIDWDQDNNLGSAGEVYPIGTITNSTGVDSLYLSLNISVPMDAVNGSTRMRVVKNYNAYVSGPCSANSYGQAEDYTITVIDDSCEL